MYCSLWLLWVNYVQVPHFANYFAGNCYVGPRDREIKEKNNRIEELEREVKQLKAKVASLENRYEIIHSLGHMYQIITSGPTIEAGALDLRQGDQSQHQRRGKGEYTSA